MNIRIVLLIGTIGGYLGAVAGCASTSNDGPVSPIPSTEARTTQTPLPGVEAEELRQQAVQTILTGSRSNQALLRMHAVEGAKSLPDRALPIVQLALEDENPAVRFAALVTTGRLPLESLAFRAQRISNDPSQPGYVRAAALYAAHRNGVDVDLSPLAEMLWDRDERQRANAALLLGLAGERSAIPVLRDAAKAPMERSEPVQRELVRLQIYEALLNLGEEASLKPLRVAAYSNQNEVRVLAVLMLGRAMDRSMEGNFVTFLPKDPVELRLAAAESLARLGSREGLPVMLEASLLELATVRSQAAFALGQAYPQPAAARRLAELMRDPEPRVRLAAAAAVLEALDR
ncbi:MAG: HEAT repeat domain-containing protein [Planctomycetota bacterium]